MSSKIQIQTKSIEQLENDVWNEPAKFPTELIEKCFYYRKIAIPELTNDQIRLLIAQKIGIEHLIGIALEKLERDVLVACNFYDGDSLIAVSFLSADFWNKHPNEFWIFHNLLERNSILIHSELGVKKYNGIIERIKPIVQYHSNKI